MIRRRRKKGVIESKVHTRIHSRMANPPRKFSEKIALLEKNQQDGNTAFNQILGEMARIVKKKFTFFYFINDNYLIKRINKKY